MRTEQLMRWLILLLPALACMSAPGADSPAVASDRAAQGESATRGDRARIDRLRHQIKQLTDLSPLTVGKALAILGTRKGASRDAGTYNAEWALAPTDLIDGGRVGKGTNRPYAYVDITPAASVGLTFEDVASPLLHVPYTTESLGG
jgi:hypothetical protein